MKKILLLIFFFTINAHSDLLSDDYAKSEETVDGTKYLVLTYTEETVKKFQDEKLAYKNLSKEELLKNYKSVVSDSFSKFELNIESDLVSAQGIIVPTMLGDNMGSNSGQAILNVKRKKDGKSFNLFLKKLYWWEKFPCVGMTDWDFDTDGCELKNKDNLKIENFDEVWSYEYDINEKRKMTTTLISFHDIDNDGKKELLYTEHYVHRSGSRITAFNIINTKDQFQLDEKEPISIVFDATSSSEFKDDKFIERLYGSCCSWEEREWVAKGNSFVLKTIKEYLPLDYFD
jgi:hypothetical protein